MDSYVNIGGSSLCLDCMTCFPINQSLSHKDSKTHRLSFEVLRKIPRNDEFYCNICKRMGRKGSDHEKGKQHTKAKSVMEKYKKHLEEGNDMVNRFQEKKEARIKDNEESIGDLNFLHPSIVEAAKDSDRDDDPETMKNGTTPGTDSTHKRTDSTSVSEPSNKGPSFRRRSPASPGFHDAGSNLSTPAMSRESCHASSLPKEEIGLGSARSSPYEVTIDGKQGAHVGEIDDWAKRQHLESGSPEKGKEKESPGDWSDVPQKEDQGDRKRKREADGKLKNPLVYK